MNKAKTSHVVMAPVIKGRFDDLFLDAKLALANMRDEGKPQLSPVEIEQSKTARSLLKVERQAILEKDLNNTLELNYQTTVTQKINKEVETRLIEELRDIKHLADKVIGIDSSLPALLDVISVKAATISKIEPIATELPWFYNDLMKMVNQKKYRREDSHGKVVLVDSLKVGLSFFGLENLIIVVTSLAFKRWLPQITDPYPQIKLRIWEEALATALSCQQIAIINKVNPNHAFCLGMLQTTGKIAITRMYFKLFETVQREALAETEKNRKHKEHKALRSIHASGDFLNTLLEKYAFSVSTRIIEQMNMQRVFISNAMNELHQNVADSELSTLAVVLKQSNAYAKYRMLKNHKLIDMEQAREYVRTMNMPKGALELLKTTDVRSLHLSVVD